jgi:glucose/mannose transport system substrate-binding protein
LDALESPSLPNQLLAVPLNIHQLNLVYYNRKRFESKFGTRPFFSIDELCGTSEVVPDLQGEIVIGQDDDFSLILLTLESVLPALTSGEFYDRLLRGEVPDALDESGDYRADVRRAFACVQHLSKFFQRGAGSFEWVDALNTVAAGNATFTVMGDWANGALRSALDDGSVEMLPFPGSEATFVFTSDTFPLPTKALHAPEAAEFLEYLATAKTQAQFSDEKGSIPARHDAEIGAWLKGSRTATRERFGSANVTRVLATSGLCPANYPRTELLAKLRSMTAPAAGERELNEAFSEFMAALPLLKRWQELLAGNLQAP